MRIPISALDAGGARSKKATIENLVNMYAEKAPNNAMTPYVLYQCEGLTEFCNLGSDPILRLHTTSDDRVFAITKTKIYEINSNKTFTERGTFSGNGLTDFVSTADNGSQLVIVDGSRGFVLLLTTNTLNEITAQTGFYPANHVVFMDGYFIFNRAGTGQFFISALYDTTTDPLDFATAESAPDDTIGLSVFSNQLWLFGQKTIEIWYNSGDALFPFSRVSGGVINRGCLFNGSIKKGYSTLYFVGDDGLVYGIGMSSYVPQRISTYAIEKDIMGETQGYSFVFTQYGHEFYMLHLPNNERTWCYDVVNALWHERRSTVINPTFLVPEQKRHISRSFTDGFGYKLVGSRLDGKLYFLDKNSAKDNGQVMVREMVSSPIFKENRWLKCSMFEVIAECTIKSDSNPLAILQWSDDTQSWSDGVQMVIGKLGDNNFRYVARRLGRFRNRSFRVTITDDAIVYLVGAFAEVEQ